MQNEKNIIRLFGGLTFVSSLIVYLITIAPTTSFWDCGEFITCSYILGVPHPPGAPFYLLIGRIFTLLPIAGNIALRVNIVSALSSALTVMLAFLIIVRLIKQWRGASKSFYDTLILLASGLVGSLAFAFSDTFWFSAVEAEVYAISMMFTAMIVWCILVWLEKADEPGNERYLLLIAYFVGLAIGVHLLMILALPAIFMIIYFKILDQRGEIITWKNLLYFVLITGGVFAVIYPGVVQFVPRIAGSVGMWFLLIVILAVLGGVLYGISQKKRIFTLAFMALLLVLTGYSTYTMIYIRSNADPAVDENNPETMEKMVKYLNREQYGSWGTFPRRFPDLPPEWQFERQYPNQDYKTFRWDEQMDFFWNYQIKKMYFRYFGWQFIGKGTTIGQDGFIAENLSFNGLFALPFLLGVLGMVHHFSRHWRHALFILALFFLTGLAIIIYLNQPDPQPRERDYVYVGSFFAFSIWIGMGVTAVLEWLQERVEKIKLRMVYAGVAILLALVMAPGILFAHNFQDHDRSGNFVAYDYSYNILETCEKDGIVFTNGDNDTFPLWYLQYVENIRPDVRVVNLSLLNTDWYIKQLKHEEPKVPISIPDHRIDDINIQRWEKSTIAIPVTEQGKEDALNDMQDSTLFLQSSEYQDSKMRVTVEPTIMGQALRVQDYMILNIILANRWEKPIYFAVTVSDQNKINLDNYLRMDGLCFKLVPYQVEHVYGEKLEKNLDKFKYRNLDNPDVYFNKSIIGLLQNYRAAYLRLVWEYRRQGDDKAVVRALDKMQERIPFKVIPPPDPRLMVQVANMYQYADANEKSLDLVEYAYEMNPSDSYIAGTYINMLEQQGKYEQALEAMNKWQGTNPDDQNAQRKMQQLEEKIKNDTSLIDSLE
ncbi:MAG: DUF2723 domain-containing protein [candidate division KSB1 bacterium]|nr:DUF2723 domain-containing protein [candidate division KSB1 bacterium]